MACTEREGQREKKIRKPERSEREFKRERERSKGMSEYKIGEKKRRKD